MRANQQPREFELKFTGSAADLAAMKMAAEAQTSGQTPWRTDDLRATYFDTPDHRLFGKGVVLRVRRSGDSSVQTVKVNSGAGGAALNRIEWEQDMDGLEPDLSILPRDARRALGTILPGELIPAVTVQVTREKAVIVRENAFGPDLEIEVAIDRGSVHAAGKSMCLSECELELLGGEPMAFFQMAVEVLGGTQARLSRTSKPAKGFALFNGSKPKAVKAPKFLLKNDQTVSGALMEIFGVCIANIVDNEAAALDGTDIEGVHQIRVSIRKMRSILTILNQWVDRERIDWLRVDLKWLHTVMGAARDWDVFITETLAGVEGYGIDKEGIEALRDLAEARRKKAYRLVRDTIESNRYGQMILRLTAFFETEGWLSRPIASQHPLIGPFRDSAGVILSRLYGKLLKEGKNLAGMEMEKRHDARIRLKKLRYAIDFLQNIYPSSQTKSFLANLEKLQDQFGYLNDVAQTGRMIGELFENAGGQTRDDAQLYTAAGLIVGWHAQRLHGTEPYFLECWDAFVKTPPFWPVMEKSGITP